jgi:thioredoxin 2
MISPALEELARARAGTVKLVKVNVDDSPQIAGRHGVQSIPTLLVLDHGKVVARHTGAAPEAALRSWLDEALTKLR